jgi:hypothetical protein
VEPGRPRVDGGEFVSGTPSDVPDDGCMDTGTKAANTLAVLAAAGLAVAALLLYGVMSQDALTANLMDGQYPPGAPVIPIKALTIVSILTAIGGCGLLAGALIVRRTVVVFVVLGLSICAILVYAPLAIIVVAVAFS